MTTVRRATSRGDWAHASTLMHEYVEWMRTAARFDPFVEQPSFADELASLAAHYASSDKALFVAFRGEQAVGTVAVWSHVGGAAELKRMYVRPAARGLGVADALIGRAVSLATRRSCRHVWLESVRGPMDPAIAVYLRNGFTVAHDQEPTLAIGGLVVMRRPLEPEVRCG